MDTNTQIKVISAKAGVSVSEIGRRMNSSPQAFSQKVKRGNLSLEDLGRIAQVLGCRVECNFVFPDGFKIDMVSF